VSKLAAWGPALMLGAAACGSAVPSGTPGRAVAAIRYEAQLEALEPGLVVLDVEETIVGGADDVFAEVAAGVLSVEVAGAHGRRVVPAEPLAPGTTSARWRIGCDATCRVHYRYDLGRAAEASQDALDVALRSGPDILAPASTWLLRPEPLTVNIPVELTVKTPESIRFACGFHRGIGGAFDLRSQELSVAGFTAFGTFQTARVQATGGTIDVAMLTGGRRASDATLVRWVHDTAVALDTVYDRFPVTRAQIFLVPEPGSRRVEMGRTLPAGGASIAVFVGSKAREADLYDDWILAHEMFHLGVPSFWQEGRWLDEGLATYYEPVLRARAGLQTESELWREFSAEMQRGLGRPGDPALTETSDHDRVYWGGALFVLHADMQIRARTKGARSLDDGLRAVLAKGGDATRIWSVDYFLRVIDEAVGVPVTTEMLAQAALPVGAPCSAHTSGSALGWSGPCPPAGQEGLAGLWRDLGIERPAAGKVALRGDAPLAGMRQRIAQAPGPRSAVAASGRSLVLEPRR